MTGGQFVIKDCHSGGSGFNEHFYFQRLTFADEAVRIGGMTVLENFAGTKAAGGLQKGFQFLQSFIGCGLGLGKAIGVQANQYRPLDHMLFKICFHSYPHLSFSCRRIPATITVRPPTDQMVIGSPSRK